MKRLAITIIAALLLAGCTVHPKGEREERDIAIAAGKTYEKPVEKRVIPPLPDRPSGDDLVRFALLNSADVERSYWEWRAALEQVPIDGTQATNLSLSLSSSVVNGSTSWGQTTITAGNDPMADVVLPNKLDAAARRSLEMARAAGKRFHKMQLELRAKVLDAYYDYALNAELIRLSQQNIDWLQIARTLADTRVRTGGGSQAELLKAENELDMAQNDLANLQAQLPANRAMINALLNRPALADLPVPDAVPSTGPVNGDDAAILGAIDSDNPELKALADEIRSRKVGIETARLQYQPDFSISAGTDLRGITQTLSSMITVPILKYEAIHAAIAQAEANLKAAEAARRQSKSDLAAQAISDLVTLRDADRQLSLLEQTILPRAKQIVPVTRQSYETGRGSLLELFDAQRSLLDIERLVANLRTMRNKRLASIESMGLNLATHNQ
jgi:cobalt-zinc-cadmium efflux system outer membrane protein